MVLELGSETEYPVEEDGQTFVVFLDAMYAKGNRQAPIAMDSVGTILELARKYIVANVTEYCDQFLEQQELNQQNFGEIHGLASKYHLAASLVHCRK